MSALDKTGLEAAAEMLRSLTGTDLNTAERAEATISAYLSTTSAGVTEQMLTIMRQHVLIEAGDDELRAALEASLSSRVDAPVSQKEAVAVGERVVPVEPTDAMLTAGRAHAVPATQGIGAIYRAMLAAAPVTHDEPVAEVVWFDPALELMPRREPHKIIDASLDFMDKAPLGTKLYASPAPAGEPGIKALEWVAHDGYPDSPNHAMALGLGITYRTARVWNGSKSAWMWWLTGSVVSDDWYGTPEAAKAAAQADYERRIRSALVHPTPVSAPVGVVEALEPFVRHYEAWMDRHSDDTLSSSYSPHTFGQLRRARAVLAALRSPAVEGK